MTATQINANFSVLILFVIYFSQVYCEYKVVCYFSNWSQYRKLPYKFTVDDVDPRFCTHVVLAFAKINDVTMDMEMIEYNDDKTYTKLQRLKLRQPELKTLIAVGGYGLLSVPFSKMTSLPEYREQFINQSLAFVTKHGFDGLDLDWEYPTYQTIPNGKQILDEKEFYTELLKEMSPKFKEAGLILSAAVPAGIQLIDQGYDVPVLNKYLYFVSLMSYDLNGPWNSVTGHPTPLYSDDNKNVRTAAEHWVSKGLDRSKLLIGLSTYARTFNLASQSQTGVGSPIDGAGTHGEFTGEQGIMAYYEVCSVLADPNSAYRQHWLDDQRVPYIEDGNNWIGYEDEKSIKIKIDWLKKSGFGGAMIWTVDMDDFPGECSTTIQPYPLVSLIFVELQAKPGSPGEPCISNKVGDNNYCADSNAVCDLETSTCKCKQGYVEDRKTCKKVVDPGTICVYTNNMCSNGSACDKWQQTCVCTGATFIFRNKCLPTTMCSNGSACDKWQQTCVCTGATFIFNNKCLPKGKLHEDCTPEAADISCIGDLTACSPSGMCECVMGSSHPNDIEICIKDKATGGYCNPDETKPCDKFVDQCICTNGTCVCTEYEFCEYQADGFFADPDDCRRYYRCFRRETFHLRCSEGLFWNNDMKICAFDAQHCGVDSLPPTTRRPKTTTMLSPTTPLSTSWRGAGQTDGRTTESSDGDKAIQKDQNSDKKPPSGDRIQNGQGANNQGINVLGKSVYGNKASHIRFDAYLTLQLIVICMVVF